MMVISLISALVVVLMAEAASRVNVFTITPDTGIARDVQVYTAAVETTGVKTLNITIPAGFGVVAPTNVGEEIGRAELNTSDKKNWTLVFRAGPDPAANVTLYGFNDTAVRSAEIIFPINYTPGGLTTILSPWTQAPFAKLRLPTAVADGSLNITMPTPAKLLNVTVTIGQFVRNPRVAGNYTFTANGVSANVSIIPPPVEVPPARQEYLVI